MAFALLRRRFTNRCVWPKAQLFTHLHGGTLSVSRYNRYAKLHILFRTQRPLPVARLQVYYKLTLIAVFNILLTFHINNIPRRHRPTSTRPQSPISFPSRIRLIGFMNGVKQYHTIANRHFSTFFLKNYVFCADHSRAIFSDLVKCLNKIQRDACYFCTILLYRDDKSGIRAVTFRSRMKKYAKIFGRQICFY